MAERLPSQVPAIPEKGRWSPAEQNKLRDSLSQGVIGTDITAEKHKVKDGDTLAAVAFAFDKAYKKAGKPLKINWKTKVEYKFKDAAENDVEEKGKLSEANVILPGDEVGFRKDGNEVVIVINKGGAVVPPAPDFPDATAPEWPDATSPEFPDATSPDTSAAGDAPDATAPEMPDGSAPEFPDADKK
ncbi:MAG: hypothetical protein WC873_02655 [Candidatus Gracilibacteria bacterium]